MKSKYGIGFPLLLALTIAGTSINLLSSSQLIKEYVRVSQLKKAYMEESASINELGTPEFEAYGGDLLVKVQVAEKGSVTFWYDPVFVPRLTVVNGKSVEHECKPAASTESFLIALEVNSSSPFIKDFDFEIKSLADLTAHFDQLVAKIDEYYRSPASQVPVFLELPSLQSMAACLPVHSS